MFRYIAKLLKVEIDAIDIRYAKAQQAAQEVKESAVAEEEDNIPF